MDVVWKALVALAVLSVAFGLVERLFGAMPRRAWGERSRRIDVVYFLLNPLVTKPFSKLAVVAVIVPIALVRGVELGPGTGVTPLVEGSWVTAKPVWLQVVLLVVTLDFIGYWVHRLFHRGRLWSVHAVHHSSRSLDWIAGARIHPLNDALGKMLRVLPMVLLGFDPVVVVGVTPVLGLFAVLLHANVPWNWGPLRYVVVSPAFHRWHHTSEAHGLDKNFAGLLPIWDLLFGTFHMPHGEAPAAFGLADEPIPEGLWGQLAYPFRSRAAEASDSR